MPDPKRRLRDLVRVPFGESPRSGFLRLDMNEGIPGLPEAFVRKVRAGIDRDFLSRYPEYFSLKKKLARHTGLKPSNIGLAGGSDGAIKNLFEAFIEEGDKVLLTDPTFAMYPVYCDMFGAIRVSLDYKPDLSFPYEQFDEALGRGVKLAVIVNPNNPTGSVLAPDKLLALIRKASERGVLFVVDEAYFYFYDLTAVSLVKRFDNLVVLRTFSKLCGLAAGRIGYACASPAVIEGLRRVKSAFDVNGIGALFAERLLDEPAVMRRLIREVKLGREFLSARLEKAGIPFRRSLANFLLIETGRRTGAVRKALSRRGILVGGGFRQPYLKNFIRVTVGDRPVMRRFWNAFRAVWERGA